MEDHISRAIRNSIKGVQDSWSKDLADIRSMLQELVGNLAMSNPIPVEFQRFYGKNPELWISQAERYFDFYEIAENHKLSLASSYLDGDALTWYRWLFQNRQLADWKHFVAKVLIRFRKQHLESPKDCLANLRQVTTVIEYPSRVEVVSSGIDVSHVLSPCLAHVHPQWINITNSPLLRNYDEQSESKRKIDALKVFDERLTSCCPTVFAEVQSDTPIEMLDNDECPQREMSNRYVTATSLDLGSSKQKIEFEPFEDTYLGEFFLEPETIEYLYLDKQFLEIEDSIPPSNIPSDGIMVVLEHGKPTGEFNAHNILCQFPFGSGANLFIVTVHRTAMNVCVWDPGLCFKSKALVGYTMNMESLLLLGSTVTFYLIAYANYMTQVWDPGWKGCMRSSILLSAFELEVAIFLDYNYCNTHLETNIQTKVWKKTFRRLFVVPSQSMSLALNAISECRRKTHPAIRLDRFVQSLWSLTDFLARLTERVSSPPVHINYWTCYFTRPSTDFLADALAITPRSDVVLDAAKKNHGEGIIRVLQGVIAGETRKKYLRARVTVEMIVVFDPGGGDFDLLILEDRDGVFEAFLKAITNLFIYSALLYVDNFDRLYLKATLHDITKSKYGLSLFGFYFLIESDPAVSIRVNGVLGEMWRKTKGNSNIDSMACLRMFATLELHHEVNGVVESMADMAERFSTLSRTLNRQLITVDLRIEILEKNGCQGICAFRSKSYYGPHDTSMYFTSVAPMIHLH